MHTADNLTIVQSITTNWSKQSRGAPGAIQRNALPEALRIPLENCPQGHHALIEHKLDFDEWRNFDDPHLILRVDSFEPEDAQKFGCVLVQKIGNGLRVGWKYTPEGAGMPLRIAKKNDFFDLTLNQWGRVIYNGRFSEWEGGWWYRKTVLNIGLFEGPVATTVFVETSPGVVMDKMAKLY